MSETFTKALSDAVDDFAKERDWEQFHSPKNLSMALMVEAAELAEHFQWLTARQSGELSPERLDEAKVHPRVLDQRPRVRGAPLPRALEGRAGGLVEGRLPRELARRQVAQISVH